MPIDAIDFLLLFAPVPILEKFNEFLQQIVYVQFLLLLYVITMV
jgi:hypothetical protein